VEGISAPGGRSLPNGLLRGPTAGFCTLHALAAAVPLVCETQERLLRRLSAAEQIALQELVDRVTA